MREILIQHNVRTLIISLQFYFNYVFLPLLHITIPEKKHFPSLNPPTRELCTQRFNYSPDTHANTADNEQSTIQEYKPRVLEIKRSVIYNSHSKNTLPALIRPRE
jgi:hypothetical protein